MQATVFTQFILPGVIALVMFGMGLSLVKSDFTRLLAIPKAIFVGLFGQVVLLPLLAFSIAYFFNAPPEIAIGLMILAACPGGTSSNLISHVAKANLALSVSLTAITTMICMITTPLLIKGSISFFSIEQVNDFSLIKTSLGLWAISIVPAIIGMMVRAKYSKFARRAEPKFRALSTIFLVVLIAIISYQERETLVSAFPSVFLFAIGLNIGATLLGLSLASVTHLSAKDSVTLGIEIGTQNASLAMLISISFIQEPAFALAAGVYGVFMYIGAFALVVLKRKHLATA